MYIKIRYGGWPNISDINKNTTVLPWGPSFICSHFYLYTASYVLRSNIPRPF